MTPVNKYTYNRYQKLKVEFGKIEDVVKHRAFHVADRLFEADWQKQREWKYCCKKYHSDNTCLWDEFFITQTSQTVTVARNNNWAGYFYRIAYHFPIECLFSDEALENAVDKQKIQSQKKKMTSRTRWISI